MRRLAKTIIRASAFFRKEIVEVLRQPRLILTLVFGPFLILLLFGVGYRNEPRVVRTLFVADEQSGLVQQIQEQAPNISPQLNYQGVVADPEQGLNELRRGAVDLVIVAPDNAYEKIRNNEHAQFDLYHNEIDPAQIGYIQYLGQIVIDEVNRRVLGTIAEQGQSEASDVQADIRAARENAAAMKAALQAGDTASARGYQRDMRGNVSAVSLAVGASMGLLSGVQESLGPGDAGNPQQETLDLINQIQGSPSNSGDIEEGKSSYAQEITELERTEQDLATLEEKLAEFQRVSPSVLVRPFTTNTSTISPVVFTPLDYFTPGVIVLLLQHIAVTIASLSIVRERRSGTLELFRVSPITAAETLAGKYISYSLFTILIGVVLSLLLKFGLNIPMLGRWEYYALVCFLVIFASLGLGFLISITSQTESQAVQFSMIILLLSVFFSGFLLDLRYLWDYVKIVSFALPATHGSILLQSIMLRGQPPIQLYLLALAGIAVFLLLLNWILMRRRMRNE